MCLRSEGAARRGRNFQTRLVGVTFAHVLVCSLVWPPVPGMPALRTDSATHELAEQRLKEGWSVF